MICDRRISRRGTITVWLSLFVVVAAQVQADDRELIVWTSGDFPPYEIISGTDKGNGVSDRARKVLNQRLTQFRHENHVAPVARIMEEPKTKPNICRAMSTKTPGRDAVLEFSSIPIIWTLPNGVISTRNRVALFQPFLNERGELRLDAFLANDTGYRIGISAGRSFGTGIDAVLKKYAGQRSIVSVQSSDYFHSSLLKLVNQDEFDAIIGYAVEFSYIARRQGINERDFVFFPIAGEPSLTPRYVSCSKTEFGKRVITFVNPILKDKTLIGDLENAYRSWLDKENLALYDRLMKRMRSGEK